MFWLLWVQLLYANPYLDYRTELEDQVLYKIIESELSDPEIEALVQAFHVEVFASYRLCYEVALYYNRRNELAQAMHYYNQALLIYPNYTSALYDRAELFLLQSKVDLAKQDLQNIIHHSTEDIHWVVYYRLAQISASVEDGVALENYMQLAVTHGLPVQVIVDDRIVWQQYCHSKIVNTSMSLFLSAIGAEDILQQIQPVLKKEKPQ